MKTVYTRTILVLLIFNLGLAQKKREVEMKGLEIKGELWNKSEKEGPNDKGRERETNTQPAQKNTSLNATNDINGTSLYTINALKRIKQIQVFSKLFTGLVKVNKVKEMFDVTEDAPIDFYNKMQLLNPDDWKEFNEILKKIDEGTSGIINNEIDAVRLEIENEIDRRNLKNENVTILRKEREFWRRFDITLPYLSENKRAFKKILVNLQPPFIDYAMRQNVKINNELGIAIYPKVSLFNCRNSVIKIVVLYAQTKETYSLIKGKILYASTPLGTNHKTFILDGYQNCVINTKNELYLWMPYSQFSKKINVTKDKFQFKIQIYVNDSRIESSRWYILDTKKIENVIKSKSFEG